ncbi:MAG: class I SAM-dependent methyltransferase [Acidobacteriota bacterium]|nr:class I SAM-dependent methyltransferase [Acidobacteriota bacterium]
MYRYFKLVNKLAQSIIREYAHHGGAALDATLGNGHDTAFLLELYQKVYAFDIQEAAVRPWLDKAPGLTAVCDSHDRLDHYIKEPLDAVMYNLGFWPGSDRVVVTKPETTIPSLQAAAGLLRPGGIMTVAVYLGHPEGRAEHDAVSSFLAGMDRREFGVIQHRFHNFSSEAPVLYVVEKNAPGKD